MGSNLGNREEILNGAFFALKTIDPMAQISSFYENEAWGGVALHPFLNAVCQLSTGLSPEELLVRLQTIENAFGRERVVKWGDRTLDLDILLFGDLHINSETLQVPHHGIWNRESVMIPLKELVGEDELMRLKTSHSTGFLKKNCDNF